MSRIRVIAPGLGKCPVCAGKHGPTEDHMANSLYYLYRLCRKAKRLPCPTPPATDAAGPTEAGRRGPDGT